MEAYKIQTSNSTSNPQTEAPTNVVLEPDASESTTSPRSVDDAVLKILQMVSREMSVYAFFRDIRQENTAWATEAAGLAIIALVLVLVAVFVVIFIHKVYYSVSGGTHGGALLYITRSGERPEIWRA